MDVAGDDAAVLERVADEVPFPFLAVGLEDRALGDLLDDGTADVRLLAEVGLLGRDLEFDGLAGRALRGQDRQDAEGQEKDAEDGDRFLVHAGHALSGL